MQRGDTWWSLAEEVLGAGGRWSELRDLNLGREVEPGTTVDHSTILRAGWELLLPRQQP